jgi:hypothetical protein
VTPAEACQERRIASIRRSHRIDALDAGQLANFIHRLAAIMPGDVDRVLAEFDANAPRPRAEPQLHPVTFYAADPEDHDLPDGGGLLAYCRLCPNWHSHIHDGESLADLERRVREHSGIEK